MNGTTDIHPDTVLASLLAKGCSSRRRENLEAMHELCRRQHKAGSRDFSLPTVGRLAEAEGGIMKRRALYNGVSDDYKTLIEAWAEYSYSSFPDDVLVSLLAKGGNSNRQANLKALHELCRRQHEAGSRDFSRRTVGQLAEIEGIMQWRSLYNGHAADYRTLIKAWAEHSGPPAPKPPKMLKSQEYLMRIEDPAVRCIMQSIIAERDKLKAQINELKKVLA